MSGDDPRDALMALLRAGLDRAAPAQPLGLALSGGGDSMALLYLARGAGYALRAVTVDHGARDVRAEIALCQRACAALDVPHEVLRWSWDGRGNFQAAARQARRDLIATWAQAQGLGHVMLAHTRDDQAETVLLRMARGSGVDGLAGMAAQSGIWLRPLLGASRAALRDALAAFGADWAEDPSNLDRGYDRVRARQMAGHLADLGLTPERLVQLADHAGAARRSLRALAVQAAERLTEQGGDLWVPPDLLDFEHDTPRRLIAAALQWIGGQPYRPRWAALTDAVARAQSGKVTLAGCVLRPDHGGLRIGREPAAVAGPVPAGQLWDGRWTIRAASGTVGALGAAGLAQCPDWRAAGLGRDTLLASPALWRAGVLIAAPLAGMGAEKAELGPDFRSFLLSR